MKAASLITAAAALCCLLCLSCSTQQAKSAGESGQIAATDAKGVHELLEVRSSPTRLEWANGARGRFEVRLSLKAPADGTAPARFDRAMKSPALRIAAPEQSGVRLGAPAEQARQTMVPLTLSDDGTQLSAEVEYSVASRGRTGSYELELDVATAVALGADAPTLESARVSLPFRTETPVSTKVLLLCIIALAVLLLIFEWVRVDVVALLMMLLLPIVGVLEPQEAFRGLSSNAVVAIIGLMMLSAGLNKVGIVSRVIKPIIGVAGKRESVLLVALSALIGLMSSVMQNTRAAVLFLPGIRHASREIGTPISRILMPIGMCAILGGTMTMIGTSPLILLNDILPAGTKKFELLELLPIGAALLLGGIVYFATVGRYLLTKIGAAQARRAGTADRAAPEPGRVAYHEMEGPFELSVAKDYVPRGNSNTVSGFEHEYRVHIVAIDDASGATEVTPPAVAKIKQGSHFCVYGSRDHVERFAEAEGFRILATARRHADLFNPAVAGTLEAVVSPRSSLIGKTIHDAQFRRTFGVTPLALFRGGRTYYKEHTDIPLTAGDAILMHAPWERFQKLRVAYRHFVFATPLDVEVQHPHKATAATLCFFLALTLMLISSVYFPGRAHNPIPLFLCLMIGAVSMVLTGTITIREAYESVDWRTVFLLGGLIPLAIAVDRTGTARWAATHIISVVGGGLTPLLLLFALATIAGLSCLFISNVGACTLLAPLGVAMAAQIGIDPRVGALVVALGVSNSFLLPTHQVNALYMGPGDYRTKDYVKVGGGLSLLYICILATMAHLLYL